LRGRARRTNRLTTVGPSVRIFEILNV